MTEEEYDEFASQQEAKKGARLRYILMFLASLTGVLAPPAGIAAVFFTWRERRMLVGHDGAYLALGYGTTVIGAAYSLVFTILALGG
jgi:hypothetical protein